MIIAAPDGADSLNKLSSDVKTNILSRNTFLLHYLEKSFTITVFYCNFQDFILKYFLADLVMVHSLCSVTENFASEVAEACVIFNVGHFGRYKNFYVSRLTDGRAEKEVFRPFRSISDSGSENTVEQSCSARQDASNECLCGAAAQNGPNLQRWLSLL